MYFILTKCGFCSKVIQDSVSNFKVKNDESQLHDFAVCSLGSSRVKTAMKITMHKAIQNIAVFRNEVILYC